MSGQNNRDAFFQQCNEETEHQRMAGQASWWAFSARWRAGQGLPLLGPSQVQYLSPQDFCNGLGRPLVPTEQRRLYRQYVQAWARQEALVVAALQTQPLSRRRPMASTTVPMSVRSPYASQSHDVGYGGRDDVKPWEQEALLPTRPYTVPVAASEEGSLEWVEIGFVEDDEGYEVW